MAPFAKLFRSMYSGNLIMSSRAVALLLVLTARITSIFIAVFDITVGYTVNGARKCRSIVKILS